MRAGGVLPRPEEKSGDAEPGPFTPEIDLGNVPALDHLRGGRKAMILVTEGSDTNSRADVETLRGYVRKAGVPIDPIAVNSGILDLGAKSKLKELAAATGARRSRSRGRGLKELPSVLARIEADLRARHVVRFQPIDQGGSMAIATRPNTVRVLRPGVQVGAAAAYVR